MNSLFRLSVMVLGIGVLLFWINWQLALVALLPVPIIGGFTYLFIKIIQPKYAEVRSSVGKMNSRLENNLGGIQVIKSSNTEPYESDRVDDVSMDYFDANWDAITTRIKFFPGLRVLAGIGFVVTFIIGGLWVFQETPPGPFTGELSVGMFVVFILYTQRFIWPMAQFGQIINMYQRARASSARIFGLMDEPSRLAEDPGAETVGDGDVVYDDVSFGYDDETIIEDVDFSVEGGETLALVGPTGAGKSTVLKLLLRMYDVDEGSIEIDGQDVRDVTLKSLRRSIGYVGQSSYLFYGTVRENITYGTFDATDEEVREAAEAAEAHDFIENLPDGYDTMVGERGVKLSGGQRQRVTIARAVLKDPDILILDEATSDVDTETEMLIQRSLDRLTEERTTFAIAHRLSTIKDADTILVLEGGEIAERGTHDELLDNDGLTRTSGGFRRARSTSSRRSSSTAHRSAPPGSSRTPRATTTERHRTVGRGDPRNDAGSPARRPGQRGSSVHSSAAASSGASWSSARRTASRTSDGSRNCVSSQPSSSASNRAVAVGVSSVAAPYCSMSSAAVTG